MAVYTDVSDEELQRFLADYNIGSLLAYKGIAEGVENSNYLLHTSDGFFILTLYEKRVAEGDLPFFLGLTEHLAARGITCPQPVRAKSGETLGRLVNRPAAIFTFLDGMWIHRPTASHCAALGEALARLHLAGLDFSKTRANALSVEAWRPLYALAVERDPAWIPTEIHIVTTRTGAENVRAKLLSDDPAWFHRLRSDYRLPEIAFLAVGNGELRKGIGRLRLALHCCAQHRDRLIGILVAGPVERLGEHDLDQRRLRGELNRPA